jgi:murein DD-endopeptidase MepM/ murein hydrolase activator NlpD
MSKMGKPGWLRRAGFLIWLVAGVGLVAVVLWFGLGHLDRDDPWVSLKPPAEVVGAKTTLTLQAGDQTSGLKAVRATIVQDGQEKVVLDRKFPPGGDAGTAVDLPLILEPKALGFHDGKATITLQARDRSWRDWFRGRTSTLTREVTIDLVPLHLTFLSVNHLLHSGGTGLIGYRLNKPAKESGVLIGDRLYQGYANPTGAQGEYVCLFPVGREWGGKAQVELVARPLAGSEIKHTVTLQVKPRRWRADKLNLSDNFLRKVASEFAVANPADPLAAFLEVNREWRRKNHEQVRQLCARSESRPLWSGAFLRFLGKPMAGFGDRRTYMYQNKAVDQQVHLGVDIASLEHSPVPAANNGLVVLAEPMGIYGQTVILDHGLGVFSQYSHLSQIDVKAGDRVEKGAVVGRSGNTGLAGGDHLHFSVALQGEYVDPLEWWDPHWLKDQVEGQWARLDPSQAPPAKAAAAPKSGKAKPSKGKAKPGKGKRRG